MQLALARCLDLPHGHVSDVPLHLQHCNNASTKVNHVLESDELKKADDDDAFVQFITLEDEKETAK